MDSWATRKTKVRPVWLCMPSFVVIYRGILTGLTIENSIYKRCKALCCCESVWPAHNLLPICRHLLLSGGSGTLSGTFTHKGSLYVVYGCMSMDSPRIVQLAWWKILDTSLTPFWPSSDTQFYDTVAILSPGSLRRKATGGSFMS